MATGFVPLTFRLAGEPRKPIASIDSKKGDLRFTVADGLRISDIAVQNRVVGSRMSFPVLAIGYGRNETDCTLAGRSLDAVTAAHLPFAVSQ